MAPREDIDRDDCDGSGGGDPNMWRNCAGLPQPRRLPPLSINHHDNDDGKMVLPKVGVVRVGVCSGLGGGQGWQPSIPVAVASLLREALRRALPYSRLRHCLALCYYSTACHYTTTRLCRGSDCVVVQIALWFRLCRGSDFVVIQIMQ